MGGGAAARSNVMGGACEAVLRVGGACGALYVVGGTRVYVEVRVGREGRACDAFYVVGGTCAYFCAEGGLWRTYYVGRGEKDVLRGRRGCRGFNVVGGSFYGAGRKVRGGEFRGSLSGGAFVERPVHPAHHGFCPPSR